MGKFINGVLVGLGAGLLFAPMSGEEMRRRIAERWQSQQHAHPYTGQHTLSDQPVTLAGNQIEDVAPQAELNVTRPRQNIEGIPTRPSTKRVGEGRTSAP